jgi:Gpi18-like mannosyltransferase
LNELVEDKKTLAAIVTIFVFEAVLSFWTGQPYDMKIWFQTGVWMNQGTNIYMLPNHIGYPPLWAFWCTVAYNFYAFLWSNIEVWRFLIKLPIIVAHLVLAIVVGDYAKNRFGLDTAKKLLWIILCWSFFIYIGAIWGQINALSTVLTFLAFYAVTRQKLEIGASLLGLAVALKTYPIVVLPAFIAFIFRNQGKKEAAKFTLIACAVPIVFTLVVFTVFRWDITYFLRTIFYSTPVYETEQRLHVIGAMNVWSFIALQGIDIVALWQFRLLWFPLLAVCAIYWVRRRKFDEKDFVLSILSFYVLFMFSYGWISEQMFIDPLPFIFLLIIAFQPKRAHLYLLIMIQSFVYIFSVANQSLFIFTPLLERFLPMLLVNLQRFHLENGPLIHTIRGTMGLVTSVAILVFLLVLAKPELLKKGKKSRSIIGRTPVAEE